MIVDIPLPDDFEYSAKALLNIAWGTTLELYLGIPDDDPLMNDGEREEYEEFADTYWSAAQKQLSTTVTFIQQGIEFLIKSRISQVSPFLLLDGNAKGWPRKCDERDTPFSDFKTIDATDLIRVHNAVCSNRLTDEFRQRYDRLRQIRNVLTHSYNSSLLFSPKEIVLNILDASEQLIGHSRWLSIRREHLAREPITAFYSDDHVDGVLAREGGAVVGLLGNAELKKYFDFDKRKKTYHCPNCMIAGADMGVTIKTAQFNAASSPLQIWCFVCGHQELVERRQCTNPECKGDLMWTEDDCCLSCWRDYVR